MSDLRLMQSNKAGWFSGWFKSKAKDVQRETVTEQSPNRTVGVNILSIIERFVWRRQMCKRSVSLGSTAHRMSSSAACHHLPGQVSNPAFLHRDQSLFKESR